MDNYLNDLIEQHAAGHRQSQRKQSVPVPFQNQERRGNERERRDPFGRTRVAKGEHKVEKRLREMCMEPTCDLVVGKDHRVVH